MNALNYSEKLGVRIHKVLFYFYHVINRKKSGVNFIDPISHDFLGFDLELNRYLEGLSDRGILDVRHNYNKYSRDIFQNETSNSSTIKSNFTDDCAKRICSLSSNREIRSIADLFIPKQKSKYSDFVHYYAMEALRIYGGQLLTFYYFVDLRESTNKENRKENLKPEELSFNPIYSLPTIIFQSRIEGSQYELHFKPLSLLEQESYLSIRSPEPLYIIMNTSGIVLYELFANSTFVSHTSEVLPEIDIFTTKQALTYGYDFGHCELCGKPCRYYKRGCLHKNLDIWM